jgi:hypothetical protein
LSIFNCKFRVVLLLAAICSLAPNARAQNRWNLTTADFQSRLVQVKSIDEAGVSVDPGDKIAWDQVLQFSRESAPKVSSGKFILHTATGDHLHGVPVKVEQENLHWTMPSLGEVTVPLRQVLAITRNSRGIVSSKSSVTEDAVSLANGDQVKGIISDVTAQNVIVQSNGSPVTVPLDSVESVNFASTAATAKPMGRAFRVKLAEGSIVLATGLQLSANQLTLELPDKTSHQIDVANVVLVEQLNGPVAWLSGLDPAENVHTPYLETARPAQMDRTVTGEMIRFGDKAFARGIGVVPYSRLTWKLDGSYAGFRTQYAMAGQGAYANVTVRIKFDDKVVHEQANFTAGVLSPVIALPTNGAKTVTLEVDYGQNFGVQDRFNWIEPALTKTIPQPAPVQPATQP